MANAVKIFDSDLEDEARVVTPDEVEEIKASTGFINNESILNDGQLTDEEESNLESSACNDNGCEDPDGDDDGGNSPSANRIYKVMVNGKIHRISQKRLESSAQFIAGRLRTFCSIAAQARIEWVSKGHNLKEKTFEFGDKSVTYYGYNQMLDVVKEYILNHPEEVVILNQKSRQRAKVRKILHLYPYDKVTEEDIEKAEAILWFVKKHKLKKYFFGGKQLYYTDSTGMHMSIGVDFIIREMHYGK